MSKVKVRIEGHYEAQEIPYGKVSVWVPAHALIECGHPEMHACPRVSSLSRLWFSGATHRA